MAGQKLADASDNSMKAAYTTLDTCIGAANTQLTKAQSRMDRIAEAATVVALAQIAKAAGGG